MRQLIYAMQFKGSAGPLSASNARKAATSAPSCSITSIVGARGLSGSIEPAAGGTATFESEVTITGHDSFQEKGTITFGAGNRLRFSTVGEGHTGPSADPALRHGAVMWRIDGGEGQFAGASGLITSNFTFGPGGEVVDNQFGLIFVK
ncbi:MAG TPA: hypothetical protein VEU62_15010 [Bryobacterales bacterium]|nr:hypothetical protein [Bryobacterales bacterium]